MSGQVVARGLSAGHGRRVLFSDLDLEVAPGDVIGLVGPNGAGKSTLLRLLARLDQPESGTVTWSPRSATVGLLPQEPERRVGETVLGFMARRTGVSAAQVDMDASALQLAAGTPGADDSFSDALERWLALGGADLEERAAQAAAELGLGIDLDLDMTVLSGGQAARAGLASLLLSRFDILLLDEPTNDLDLDGLDRLESFVAAMRVGAVVVSHDREFLARTVTRVLELDIHQASVNAYGGGYDAYLAEREVARQHGRERYDEYTHSVSQLTERARTQREWADKGVRNARKKATDRDKIGINLRAESSEKQAAKARQTDRMLERLEVVDAPRREWELHLSIVAGAPSGQVVAVLNQAVVRRGDFVLGPVTLQVDRGDRLAISGTNGSGKSTLLAALLGRIELDDGSASLGSAVRVGEVDQARSAFLGGESVAVAFGAEVPEMSDPDVRTLLAKFGLGAEHVMRVASTLSPGERTRAAMALLSARGVNLLVLDEPTNHLDVAAIEQLEAALEDYSGTLLLVTHDRRLIEAVRVTRRVAVANGTVTEI